LQNFSKTFIKAARPMAFPVSISMTSETYDEQGIEGFLEVVKVV